MKELLKQLQSAYLLSLQTHITLLTKCYTRHKGTEETYEGLFNIFHTLSEKNEQIIPSKGDANGLVVKLYSEVEKSKEALKSAIKAEKDEWVKNQLVQSYDDIQLLCAKLKSLIDEDEGYEEKEEPKVLTKKNVL